MQADYTVELGADDEILEVPWADPEGRLQYYDLKAHPELLEQIEEVRRAPELGEFLKAVNAGKGILETVKCDTWTTTEMTPEEEVFAASLKFGCYVDLIFRKRDASEGLRSSFEAHEGLAKKIVALLRRVPEIPASAELFIRRCFFTAAGGPAEGCYMTLYVFGYGDEEEEARRHWAIALKLAENAIRQIAAE